MSKEKTIYDLKLHEEYFFHNLLFVLRVPGGWIYNHTDNNKVLSSTFVPFNNEFQKPIKFDVPKYKREDIERVIKMIEFQLMQGLQNLERGIGDIDNANDFLDFVNQAETALSILKSNTK